MDRRRFLRTSGAAAAALGSGGALACAEGGAPAARAAQGGVTVDGPSVQWRMASSFPPSLDILHGQSERIAQRVEQLTGGRFTMRVYSAGELVPALQVMDAVQQGTVQAGYTGGYYYIGKNPALAFDSTVPFGLDPRQQNAWMWHGGGIELLRDVYADFGIVQLPAGNTGGQFGGWFRRPVDTPEDLRGLRMRIPGLGGEIMQRLGVSVQVLGGPDIYPALERGAIDATEWVGPYDDMKLGFHEIAPYYYVPGWWEPGLTATLQVARPAWEELPESYRHALETACREACMDQVARYDVANPRALETLVLEHGVDVRRYSDEILEAAWRESRAFLEEQAAAEAGFRTVYEAWKDYRDRAWPYFTGNELQYARFAFPRIRSDLITLT